MTIQWYVCSFVDVFGQTGSLVVPSAAFDDAAANGIPFDGSALEGRARVLESDMRLRPDPATVVELDDGHAQAWCAVVDETGAPWPVDPRTALMLTVERLPELAGEMRLGAELEFYLLDAAGTPVDSARYYSDLDGPGSEVVLRAATTLADRGVPIAAAHSEAGPGQYELDIGLLAPVAFADAIVRTKDVLRRTARRAGLEVSFMARPLPDEPGSGLHVMQSSPLLLGADGKLTDYGRSFVAGQLAHASGLCALAASTVNSYRRLHAGPEAPGAVVWGHVNRAALIRLGAGPGAAAGIEYRGADPAANAHLLVAGLIATGAAGIEDDLDLAPPSEESTSGFDPAGGSQRFAPLPRTLDDALDSFALDDVLADAFDARLVQVLLDGRRAETEAFRAHVTTWERDWYRDV
jgi:glutamine synthetase